MASLALNKWSISIGHGHPLCAMLGLNVLEDSGLTREVATELKRVTRQLALPFIFKASFDKANRSSMTSYRGPGLTKGLADLAALKATEQLPILTDIHTVSQAEPVAAIADVVQIPAFLCRQTDLVVAAAKAVARQDGLIQIKKGQFLAPWDCRQIISKIDSVVSRPMTLLCERGTQFGYNNLVVDMLAIPEMQKLGVPVVIDATHSVQLPGADPATAGASTGGRRDGVAVIARAAVAAGADAIFLEFHPNPDQARCDGPSCLPLADAAALLRELQAIHAVCTSGDRDD